MPAIPSIRTSVENKEILVLDEHAKNGVFERDSKGRLLAFSGGFSVVFPYIASDGNKWAFRCWHAEVSNSQKRYEIISEAIQKSNLDFLCEFEYIEKGINVEGCIYPTTKMRWVDGITIKDYICQNKDSKVLLQTLADNFLEMIRTLHALSLAHGDLQHGNILVGDNGQLYLVDYDSFYCPKLKGEPDNVTGLPDYQHPARSKNKSVSEKLDYFSELIIYLSILAIAENSTLIDKYQRKAESLLFSRDDFADIRHSEIYNDIYSLGEKFRELLDILEEYLKCSNINDLYPFEYRLLEKKISFTCSTSKLARGEDNNVRLEWEVGEKAEVQLADGKELKGCACHDSLLVEVDDDTTYRLIVKSKSGITVEKELTIRVFDASEIDFKVDKYYSYPTIPVKLSWNVKYAKKVCLDSVQVQPKGTKVIEPEKDMDCILSVEDEFGIKEKKVTIQMLPLPQAKTLLVPAPNITNNLSVRMIEPKYEVNVRFPTVKIDWVKMKTPQIPSLTNLGLNVELSLPKTTRLNAIKRIYKQIKNKIRR